MSCDKATTVSLRTLSPAQSARCTALHVVLLGLARTDLAGYLPLLNLADESDSGSAGTRGSLEAVADCWRARR